MKYNFLFCVHTSFFIFYSFLLSFSFLRVSLLIASPSLLSSSTNLQTLLSSSETHHRFAQAQPPQTHSHRPTFGRWPDPFQPFFSIFGVSVLCFELCLCFGFVFWAMVMFRVGFFFSTYILFDFSLFDDIPKINKILQNKKTYNKLKKKNLNTKEKKINIKHIFQKVHCWN